MFLNLLNNDEKLAFAALAGKMIEADGIVIGREAATLAAFKAEMGIGAESEDTRTVEDLAAVFHDRKSKTAALLELIGLGYSDTNFNLTERSLVTAAARQMGVDADELAKLEEWVQNHVRLVREAMALMRE